MSTLADAPVTRNTNKPDLSLSDFHAREVDFELDPSRITDWCGGDPWRTLYFNTLSLTFPVGERFFISTVAHFRDKITDPKLRAEVAAFITQEATHTREHLAYNKVISTLVDVTELEAKLHHHMEVRVKTRLSPVDQLAVTCALEHFTAIMAEDTLRNTAQTEGAEPQYRRLWTWHALEECEHKSVAYDVFQTVTRGMRNRRRMTIMFFAAISFYIYNGRFMYALMKAQGHHRSPVAWAKLMWSVFGNPGPMRRIIPNYLKYYNRNFHPRDIDDSRVLSDTRRLVDSWA
jgi:predicted metal-dependent hydrolase